MMNNSGKSQPKLQFWLVDSIGKKILLFFVLFTLMLLLLVFLLYTTALPSIEAASSEEALLFTSAVEQLVDSDLNRRIEEWRGVSKSASIQEALRASNTEFAGFSDVNAYILQEDTSWQEVRLEVVTPFMESVIGSDLSEGLRQQTSYYEELYNFSTYPEVFITNKYGAVVAATGKTSDYYQADEEWWTGAVSDEIHLEEVEYDESADVYSFALSIRVDDNQGNLLGVMKVIINKEILDRVVANALRDHEHQTHVGRIITRGGYLLYSSEPNYTLFENVSETEFFQNINHRGYFTFNSADGGEQKIYTYTDISGEYIEQLGLIAVGEHESEEVLGDLQNLYQRTFFAFILIGIFMLVALWVFLHISVVKPLRQVDTIMRDLENGRFDTRLNIDTNDELGRVSHSYNMAATELGRLNDENKELDKLKTDFIAVTSHELRSPLTPMKGNLQLLLKGHYGELGKKQKAAVETVLQNEEHLDRIINDFLELSRIEAAKLNFQFIKSDLVEPVRTLIGQMEQYLPEKNISIKLDVGKLPIIEVDVDRTMQALRNLIGNAKKFSPDKSTVHVSVVPKGENILLSVKDKGVGIAKESQNRIFEPFYQEEQTIYRQYSGVGLGLAICRGIVEAQNGRIWFESEKGKGSTFYFTVPLTPERVAKPIKLLFSTRQLLERQLQFLFIEVLGQAAEKDFYELKQRNELGKVPLLKYIDNLFNSGVIGEGQMRVFKKRISELMKESEPKAS